MSSPRNGVLAAVKRIVWYLSGQPRLVWQFCWQRAFKAISTFSGRAGCRDTQKSTLGCCAMFGKHLVKAYSRTRSNVAVGAGEAKFYAFVSAASESLGMVAMTEDYGGKVDALLYKASAAIELATININPSSTT